MESMQIVTEVDYSKQAIQVALEEMDTWFIHESQDASEERTEVLL